MKLPILVCLAALCALPASAQENLGYRGVTRGKGATGYTGYKEALAALRAKPSMSERTEKGWRIFSSRDLLESWTFTNSGHYAHPSYTKRKMVREGDSWTMQTSMDCGATKPLCERLMREYVELNKRMRDDIVKKRGT